MVKKPENLKKSENIPKIDFKKIKEEKKMKKKCFSLSFPILGGLDSTRALQSSPFQKYKNLKKS